MTTAPPAPRPSPVLPRPGVFDRIFSFPVAIAGLLVVLAVLTMRSRFDDPDMWWHLKTGEVIWTTIGVSENIIEASWQALYDSVVYGLLHAD